ncbi:MAG: hypothetical protein Q8O81_07525 [Giesbergeria sp.]|nr:hypothetical protein [Giesbergeria sp.]
MYFASGFFSCIRWALSIAAGFAVVGVQAQVQISDPPATHTFGKAAIGSDYATQYYSLNNQGSAPVTVGQVRMDGQLATCTGLDCPVVAHSDFQVVAHSDGCSGNTLAPGQGCSTLIVFTPTAIGGRLSQVVFPVVGSTDVTRIIHGTGTSQPLECVLDWAERQAQYSDLLTNPTRTLRAEQFHARCYGNGDLCIGADNALPSFDQPSLYVAWLPPQPARLERVGYLGEWASLAQCSAP